MTVFEPETDQLKVCLEDRVATITLNRPEARNALSPELSKALRQAIAWAEVADEVGALLLTGAGSAFCAGGDVKAMGSKGQAPSPQTSPKTSREPPSFETQFQELRQRHHGVAGVLRRLRKPSVAALPGAAAGAGLAIALACDMRIAADSALLTTGYAGIGLSGDYGVAWLLTRTVGPAKARQLMLTSERLTAEQALAIGLVNEVVGASALAAHSQEYVARLARGPAVAYRYIKDNLDEALSVDHASAIDREADRLLKSRTTADHKEAVAAFREKRRPTFVGK